MVPVRLVHLSDLHYGADDPAVVDGLRADLAGQAVDLVMVSGDLTMRARSGQFRAARALLDSLGPPWVSVPGNHDLPLDRLLTRQVRPLDAYRRWIASDPEPLVSRSGLVVLGLSTGRQYYWKGGRVDARQVERIGAAFAAPAGLKILMLHHPVFTSAQRPAEKIVRGADGALRAAAAAGVDMVLCGHDHVAARVDLSLSRPWLRRHLLGVMCGTTVSTRLRGGESQSYNVISSDGDRLRLQVRHWSGGAFRAAGETEWSRSADGWHESR
jgi:3',5'-cyclic AMP phosphodiesterase CpdA